MKAKLRMTLAAGFAAAVAYGACAAEDWYSDAKLGMFVHWGLYAADGQGVCCLSLTLRTTGPL